MQYSDYHIPISSIGAELSLLWIIPFIGMLLSIAILPLILPKLWHRNYGKFSAFWSISFLFPFTYFKGYSITIHKLLHVLFLEYFPFIILLLTLYTISGGIRINGKLTGSPIGNLFIIFVGTLLASCIGTTGAAMLLIRPLLRANKWRTYKVHTIIFFIFLVANIGGSLTPVGDPPLFLGFLHGVDFFWTARFMFFPMCLVVIILLFIYFIIDFYYYRKEDEMPTIDHAANTSFKIEGIFNILLIIFVISAVLISGLWKPNYYDISVFGIHLEFQNILRDIVLLLLVLISYILTDSRIRNMNGFTWLPIKEVAKLFAGIFITIIPAIAILQASYDGALGSLIEILTDKQGNPLNIMYFWLTGVLSAFLDNAPTYLVFFNIAGSSAPEGTIMAEFLMKQIPNTLMAISAGAVFMGAMTYIGNAPNFMIQSIAEENNIKMPSFFGYMAWSILILVPIFIIASLIIF